MRWAWLALLMIACTATPAGTASPSPRHTVSPVPHTFLAATAFLGETTARAAVYNSGSGQSTLLETDDAGRTWQTRLRVKGYASWMRVFNARETTFRVVTAPGPPLQTAFYRTVDGGATWTSAPAPPNPLPAPPPVYFLDINEGWQLQIPLAASTPRVLFHTVDGGLSWSELTHLDTAYDVSFKDSSNGWLAQRSLAGSPALLFTRDGGQTWLPQILTLPPGAVGGDPRPRAPRFLDSQLAAFKLSILSSGSDPPLRNVDNFLYWSRDGGETWVPGGRPPLAKVGETDYGAFDSFLDGRRGWEGSATSLFKTGDGGSTWSSVTTSLPRRGFYFAQLAVLTDRIAWGQLSDFSKRDGHQPIFVLVRTTDGGAHWTEVKVPSLDG